MASVNVCVFSGNLTSDPRVKEFDDTEVARFTVAVNGYKEGDTTFVQCSFRKPGKVLQYLKKGVQVVVTGEAKLAQWEYEGAAKAAIELRLAPGGLTLVGGKREAAEPATPF